ncbi:MULTISPECIES: MaoC/PaaZ C-terminal domain-containing protein [unclassified Streptomyces]|uniref:MaoC/PaaZ C-terminal domain-containing protein n=1 Tax=Streptomyces sp. NPDC127532 TaxID=3345399 RepID=UPI003634E57D
MALYRELVGREWDSGTRHWTFFDTALYALGVGAGGDDPTRELAFTAQGSQGVLPAVLPTFATTLVSLRAQPALGDFDTAQLLHSRQSLTLYGPLPVEGTATTTSRLAALHDQGRSALAVIESRCADPRTGRVLADIRTGLTIRREGGFRSDPGETRVGEARPDEEQPWERPAGEPDHTVRWHTPANQALLYRLSGDHNPLHSDPAVAARLGFRRPLLHGLCTYGFAGRALLHTLCGGDPARFGSLSGSFTAPVLPGQELTVRIWERGESALFEVRCAGRPVLDRGRFARRADLAG